LRDAATVVVGWAVPGLGHYVAGERARGLVIFLGIGLTFWMGVAIGGARSTIDPQTNRAWFAAQICCGAHTVGAWALHQAVPDRLPYKAGAPAVDLGIVYTAVAGLLNVLVVLDLLGGSERRTRRASEGKAP
jgi:hypothetical protein